MCCGKGEAGSPRASSYNAGSVVDRVEPVIEIQLRRLAVPLWGISCVFPMECAASLFSDSLAFEAIFDAKVVSRARFADSPVQGITMAIVKGVCLSKKDGSRTIRRACRLPQSSLAFASHQRDSHDGPTFQATDKKVFGSRRGNGPFKVTNCHGFVSRVGPPNYNRGGRSAFQPGSDIVRLPIPLRVLFGKVKRSLRGGYGEECAAELSQAARIAGSCLKKVYQK